MIIQAGARRSARDNMIVHAGSAKRTLLGLRRECENVENVHDGLLGTGRADDVRIKAGILL